MLSRRFSALCVVALILAVGVGASADPRSDIMKMVRAFYGATSFHADIESPNGGPIAIDFVAPNRYRGTLPGNLSATFIGNDVWVNTGRGSIRLPGFQVPTLGPLETYLAETRTLGLSGATESAYDISDDGPAVLDGIPTHTYSYAKRGGGIPVKVWVRRDCFPLQAVLNGSQTIRYSRIDAPITIDSP